jgi:hypothetical protein
MSLPSEQTNLSQESVVSTTRLLVTGIGLTLLAAVALPDWVIRIKGDVPTGGYLPLVPVICVLVIFALRPILPGRRWSNGELLGLFTILIVGTSGMSLVGRLIATLPSSYYYASPENDYFNHFLSEVPAFLGPRNGLRGQSSWDAMVWFYRGLPPGQSLPWSVWAEPLVWWGGLFAMVLFGQFCLASLFRKQWLDHEKLMFPHATILTSLLEPSEDMDRPLYRVKLFWYGLAASVVLFGIDGLSVYFPEIPKIGFAKIGLYQILEDYPWKALSGHRQLSIQPFIIAISYMVTTEISFSIWVISILDLVSRVFAWSVTMPTDVRNAWIGEGTINSGATQFGAVLVFIGAFLWSGRSHFVSVYRRAIGRESIDDSAELMSFRNAFWGFCFCVVGVLFWCWLVEIPLWFAALVFGVYCTMILYVSRLIAETGMVKTERHWIRPHKWASKMVGFKSGGTVPGFDGLPRPAQLMPMGVFSLIYEGMLIGNHAMPQALTGFRVSDSLGQNRRLIARLSLLALAIGTVVFAWRFLTLTYQIGALNTEQAWYLDVYHVYNNTLIRDILLKERSHTPDWTILGFMGWGMAIMGLLVYMRQAFYWWPIHPIGYITTGLNRGIWFSVFLGWLIKTRVLKYSGGEGYKQMVPLFVGLFVGEYVSAGIWAIVGVFAGRMRFFLLHLEKLSF